MLTGSAATALATVALASVGMLMLTGRIEFRRAATILLGCFMIFGAASIAQGVIGTVHGEAAAVAAPVDVPPSYAKAPPAKPAQSRPQSDPYAGAALPQR